MITATYALSLASAKLNEEEREGANRLADEIEVAIRAHMEYRGLVIQTKETRPNVIADVNQRLRQVGWITQWSAMTAQHPLNKAIREHLGFELHISPTDDVYRTVAVDAAVDAVIKKREESH